MFRPRLAVPTAALLAVSLSFTACDQPATAPEVQVAPIYAKPADQASSFQGDAVDALTQMVDDFNAAMIANGRSLRLGYPWMFKVGTGNDTIGSGTDPYARLRTGSRWTTLQPTYILDESDYTVQLPAADVEAALVAAYDTWNAVANSSLSAVRVADPGTNIDILDGTFLPNGDCATIFDVTSPNLDLVAGQIHPAADIVVGGWLAPEYFEKCLGSSNIIGVTWTFSDVDTNGDQYDDRQYVEQFYNSRFQWVTSGSQYLDGTSGVDVQTIAAHEDGHAHGLGHFGGPLAHQKLRVRPNGTIFNPEAVMNPFYAYGEKRIPYATDEGALRTMYTGL